MKNNVGKILITGSSGTIGTRLFETLLKKGYDVTGFDKVQNSWHASLREKTLVGNLLNQNDLVKIPKDIGLIIHLAANARVYDLVVEPDLALENITTTHNILEFARKNGIKKIIFSSSRETYGNKKEIISKETDVDILRCSSPYAASKIADEALIYSYQKCYGIEYVVFRFSNVYGMYDRSDRFIPLLLGKMKINEDVEVFGKDKVLDFTYIDDCVAGIIACVEKFGSAKNNVFNLASGRGTNLMSVAKIIKKSLKSRSRILPGKNRPGEVVGYVADISKVKKILGYAPKVPINEGVGRSIQWYETIL